MSVLTLENQVSEREKDKKTSITTSDISSSFSQVESGLEFILSHCSEPLFPRKVLTGATKHGQRLVVDKGHAMTFFQGALWEDCYISAFGLDQKLPNIIFIDIDAVHFVSMRALKLALTKTLKNIKEKLEGTPTVVWSGRGFHVIQPIDCPIPLEGIKELVVLEPNTSNKFLQFCARYLSAGKKDTSSNPALKSCLLKVPHTLNSKCKAAGIDAEVKIIQRWDGHRPDYRRLIGSFYAALIGKNQQLYREYRKQKDDGVVGMPTCWIEKLFETPIDDYRKRARDLILVPYLIVRKGIMDEDEVTDRIMQWADRCAEVKKLNPSRSEFEHKTRTRTDEVMQSRIPPMGLTKLQENNPKLYKEVFYSK